MAFSINQNSLSFKEYHSISDYVGLARMIKRSMKEDPGLYKRTIRVALAASFTIKGIEEILLVKCAELGISAHIYVSEYNQAWQELLDGKSVLYESGPDLIVVFLDTRDILGDRYLLPNELSDSERKIWVDEKTGEIQTLIQTVKSNSKAKVLVHNFEVPMCSPLGILEEKQEFGLKESVEALNANIRAMCKPDPQVFMFNYDAFCSKIGKQHLVDCKMYFLADARLAWQHMPALCDEYVSYIQPMMSLTRKCIVLDLDNTLWGGIIGEDGIEEIKIGPTPEGRAFWEFQKGLLALYQRGIILALCSKNNPADALAVLREHPSMVLREEHFAAMRINWNDKVENLQELAAELQLGLDSFVFVDDDRATRQLVRDALPEVMVVDMPEDSTLYLKTLRDLTVFNSLQLTEEDRKKGKLYATQRTRREAVRATGNLTEHLKSLEMVVTIENANSFNIPRISQLTLKTNQFNTTTRRYLEEEMSRFAHDQAFLVVCLRVEDKFGDNGITGVAIARKTLPSWRIDSFLLSCRVIGRRVEQVLLKYLLEQAREGGATVMIGEFVTTSKNAPAKDFYKDNGFALEKIEGNTEFWTYDLSQSYSGPDFFKVIVPR